MDSLMLGHPLARRLATQTPARISAALIAY
jgi:hypothetical protein